MSGRESLCVFSTSNGNDWIRKPYESDFAFQGKATDCENLTYGYNDVAYQE